VIAFNFHIFALGLLGNSESALRPHVTSQLHDRNEAKDREKGRSSARVSVSVHEEAGDGGGGGGGGGGNEYRFKSF